MTPLEQALRRLAEIEERVRSGATQGLRQGGEAVRGALDPVEAGHAAEARSLYESELARLRSESLAVAQTGTDPEQALGSSRAAISTIYRALRHTPTMREPHFESPPGTIMIDGLNWEPLLDPNGSPRFPTSVHYMAQLNEAQRASPATAGPGEGHISDTERSFLYLDVGQWGGAKSRANTAGQFDRHRNFGLVCGKTAAICEFRSEFTSLPHTVDPAATDHAEAAAINGVLAALQEVSVLRALRAETTVPLDRVLPTTVYVFLGDMHLPVSTRVGPGHVQTAQLGRFEWDDALWRVGLQGANDLRQRAFNNVAATAPPFLRPHLEQLRPEHGVYEGTFGSFDAPQWERYYDGADIFEDADADLAVFMARLNAYQSTQGTRLPAYLVQLGDMFDLWIGMLRYFKENPSGHVTLDHEWFRPNAWEFVDYWTVTTLVSTARSQAARDVLNYRGPKTFLYGNHDNYFAPEAYTPPLLSAMSAEQLRPKDFEGRQHFYAEHGHSGDRFNRDGATTGWRITQIVFRNTGIRGWEPSSRLDRMKTAADHWLFRNSIGLPYCIYIMGHTHRACLTNVRIRDLAAGQIGSPPIPSQATPGAT